MIWVFGIAGFILGFIGGMMVLSVLLRHRSNKDLLTDRKLHWKYGLLPWAAAALGSYSAVQMYALYFG